MTAAIHAQVDQLLHVCNGLGYLEPVTRLAEMLVARDARRPRHGLLRQLGRGGRGRRHQAGAAGHRAQPRHRLHAAASTAGRTARSALTTSNLNYRVGYGPLVPDIHIAPFPSAYRDFGGRRGRGHAASPRPPRAAASRRRCRRRATAAFLIEPVQGEGGYVPAPLEPSCGASASWPTGTASCSSPTRSSRATAAPGRMWAFEHAGIVPDVVLVAKAIANGLPLAAIVSSRELQERWGVGAHGSTYGGNPVVLRGRHRGPRDHPRGGPGRQRRRARRGADRAACRRSRPRTRASATCAGRG